MSIPLHSLDPYRHGESPVHGLDGRVKFVLTVLLIVTTSLLPSGAWYAYILLLAVVLSAEILSELGIRYYLGRSLLALPFILAALPLPFTVPGTEWFSIQVGTISLSASLEGTIRLVSIGLKSLTALQAALVLAATTPFTEILSALRTLRVPRLLASILGLMWRYLFVLVDEAQRLMRARTARSGKAEQPEYRSGGTVVWRAKVTGGMAGSLFLRSLDRSDRIYAAMLARGYDGESRNLAQARLRPLDWSVLSIGSVLLAALLGITLAL